VAAQLGAGHPLVVVRDWADVASVLGAVLDGGGGGSEGEGTLGEEAQAAALFERVDALQARVRRWWAAYKKAQGRLFADMLRPPSRGP
jgi:hypothetical protein